MGLKPEHLRFFGTNQDFQSSAENTLSVEEWRTIFGQRKWPLGDNQEVDYSLILEKLLTPEDHDWEMYCCLLPDVTMSCAEKVKKFHFMHTDEKPHVSVFRYFLICLQCLYVFMCPDDEDSLSSKRWLLMLVFRRSTPCFGYIFRIKTYNIFHALRCA